MAIVVLASPPSLAQLWYEHYENALAAIESEDWRSAAAEIQQAITQKPESVANARTYGMNFIDYFPHFQMGKIYYHLGQPDSALEAFAIEERLGVISGSEEDELRNYRDRIDQDRRQAAAEAEQHKQRIIDDALAKVVEFERLGQLDDAIRALTDAAAVDEEHPDVVAALGRLQGKVRQEQDEAALNARVDRLVSDGQSRMGAGDLQAAAALFSQALEAREDPEVRTLLDDAQSQLRAQVTARENEQARLRAIQDGMQLARDKEESGDLAGALRDLQLVLARDPGNAQASSIQTRLLRAQSRRDSDQQRDVSIRQLISDVKQRLLVADYDGVMSLSQRVLALDPSNATALGYIAQVYGIRAAQILGMGDPPPLIVFHPDRREDSGDGTKVETVDSPTFSLLGFVMGSELAEVQYSNSYRDPEKDSQRSWNTVLNLPKRGDAGPTTFEIPETRLTPGLNEISILVTDVNDQRGRESYSVFYVEPFYRSPWAPATAIGTLIAGAMVFVGYRVRKRSKLLSRRFNPYIAGAPVMQDNLFFGRDRLLARVMQSIHNNSILLYGERRIGKTSFQHQLKRRLHIVKDEKIEFFPVYIDLQGTPQEKFFAHIAEEVFEELRPLLDGLKPSAKLATAEYDYRDFVRDIKQVIGVLKARSDREVKLALLMDEVDTLNDYDPRVNQRLRSLFMRNFSENLVCVMSGVSIKKQWESEGSPWYNFFEEIQVKSFRRQDAVELIEKPVKGVFVLDRGVVDRIIELTDCKPYLIQKLCIRLIHRLHDDGRRKATKEDVDALGRPTEG